MANDSLSKTELRRMAMRDPSAVFDSPEQVLGSARLSPADKVAVLRRWAYDVSELSVALEEGMPEGSAETERNDIERRILAALDALGATPDSEHAGASKQHGLPSGHAR